MTEFVCDADVSALVDWPAAVDALRAAYAVPLPAGALPGRTMARSAPAWLRSMSAVSPSGRYLGNKLIAANTQARRASYLISLFDLATTELVALVDGRHITGMRTSATAVVAIEACTAPPFGKVAVVGSGLEAQSVLAALASRHELDTVVVFSPSPDSRARFVSRAAEQGIAVSPAGSAREAVEGAGLVLVAARSRDETPVIDGAWLSAGATVVSLGSTIPEQRELDVETLRRAARVVADIPDEVVHDTGDGIAATSVGVDLAAKTVSLQSVVAGDVVARRDRDEVVVYKSVGSALQDVVLAELVVDLARAAGRAVPLPQTIVPVDK
jgi:ornithine cyclodeaminase/alanine dehydrogenase